MNVLLVYVNSYNNTGIPIGLSYLIPILRKSGHRVSLFETTRYDFSYSNFNINKTIGDSGNRIINDFVDHVNKIGPDFIGVSAGSLCLDFALTLIESLKRRPPAIFGGVGPTVDYDNLIKKQACDYVCVGFGEECLPGLLENIANKTSLDDVPNLVHKKDENIKTNKFSQSLDLSKFPAPDWSLFDIRHFERIFRRRVKRWGNFQLTRGCPFTCTYCINDYYHKDLGMKIYRFPPEKIIEEIKALSRKYNLEIIRIFDECFGFGNIEYYKKFADLYKKATALPSIVETRPESVTGELIKVLKDINCISVSLGIEAGNEEQRRTLLNRRISNEAIKRAFHLLHKEKIRVSSYNIIGFPHDTREKIFETIKLNRECKPDFVNVFTFCPDPKTILRKYCEENGLLETEAVGEYGGKSIVKNPNLSKDELYGLYKTFRHYINLPKYAYPMIARAEKLDYAGKQILRFLEKVSLLQEKLRN